MHLSRPAVTGLAVAALAGGLLTVPAAPAHALSAPSVRAVSVSPSAPVLRAGSPATVRVTVVLDAPAGTSVDDGGWIAVGTGRKRVTADLGSRTVSGSTETWVSAPVRLTSAHAGRLPVQVGYTWTGVACTSTCEQVDGGAESVDVAASFRLRLATRVTVTAPRRAARGARVGVAGKAVRADEAGWVALDGHRVSIWFDPAGKAPARRVGRATTDASGVYAKRFRVTRPGAWYAVVKGTGTRAAATSPRRSTRLRG